MTHYAYTYQLERRADEVVFHFPQIPEIFSSIPEKEFNHMTQKELENYALDAVLTALRGRAVAKQEMPEGNDPYSLSLHEPVHQVVLSVEQAMKVEFHRVYRANCGSIAELCSRLGESETAVRRLLDFEHDSRPDTIQKALGVFGYRLRTQWVVLDAA